MALKFRSLSLYLHIPLHIFIPGAILSKEKIQENSFKIFCFLLLKCYISRYKFYNKIEYFIALFSLTGLNDFRPITKSRHCPICSAAAPIAVLMCRCEGAAFTECESRPTCLEVAAEIKHIGVKKCQSASPWLFHSTSWQRSGEACSPGMLYPSVAKKLPFLADVIEDFCNLCFDGFRIWLNSKFHAR